MACLVLEGLPYRTLSAVEVKTLTASCSFEFVGTHLDVAEFGVNVDVLAAEFA